MSVFNWSLNECAPVCDFWTTRFSLLVPDLKFFVRWIFTLLINADIISIWIQTIWQGLKFFMALTK